MPIALELNTGRVPVKVWTPDLEPEARRQLENVARLPIIHGHVAAMPDVHAGIGATVGSVIPTKGAIIPAAVGVDVGCGLHAVQLSLTAKDMPDSLRSLSSALESAGRVGSRPLCRGAGAGVARGREGGDGCATATSGGSRKARRPSTNMAMPCTGRRTTRWRTGAK